jgi:hypothetical protein
MIVATVGSGGGSGSPGVGVLAGPRLKSPSTQSSGVSVSPPFWTRRAPAGKNVPSGPITGAPRKKASPEPPSVRATASSTSSLPVTVPPVRLAVRTRATVRLLFSRKSSSMEWLGTTP